MLNKLHPALQESSNWKHNYLYDEVEASAKHGYKWEEWEAQPRWQRAMLTAHYIASNVMQSIQRYDDRPKK